MEKYGWWSVKFEVTIEGETFNFDDLDECSKEHICNLIKDGYRSGEVCMTTEDEDEDEA